MKNNTSLADRIDELQRELSLLEVPYAIAMKRESGEDQEWNARRNQMTERIFSLVKSYKIGDEPHKAVGIVAQAALLAAELTAPAFQIEQYREKKQFLKMAQQDLERRRNEDESLTDRARKKLMEMAGA